MIYTRCTIFYHSELNRFSPSSSLYQAHILQMKVVFMRDGILNANVEWMQQTRHRPRLRLSQSRGSVALQRPSPLSGTIRPVGSGIGAWTKATPIRGPDHQTTAPPNFRPRF